jgi:uncharacterized protein (TIGR02246 family)
MFASRASAKHGPPALHGARLLLVLALAGGTACRSAPRRTPPAPAGYEREIEAQNRALEALFRAGNLLGIADVYGDDAVLLDEQGQRTTGREEIDAYWAAIESPVEWRLEIRSIRGSEALAYEVGTATLVTREDAGQESVVSDFLWLWRRERDGSWRIALDAHWPRP